MFAKIFALFALVAMALAAPSPKAAPESQLLTYSYGSDYVYPAAAAVPSYPSYVSPYVAAAAPVAYSAYPGGTVFVR